MFTSQHNDCQRCSVWPKRASSMLRVVWVSALARRWERARELSAAVKARRRIKRRSVAQLRDLRQTRVEKGLLPWLMEFQRRGRGLLGPGQVSRETLQSSREVEGTAGRVGWSNWVAKPYAPGWPARDDGTSNLFIFKVTSVGTNELHDQLGEVAYVLNDMEKLTMTMRSHHF